MPQIESTRAMDDTTSGEALLVDLDSFPRRHIGISDTEALEMSETVGYDSLEALINAAVPKDIRISGIDDLPEPLGESSMLNELEGIAKKNKVMRSYIGMGYANAITPPVIQRNILENPGWYTQYTPYQAEISQGRMEALLNFQTLVADLTGLEIANASLLDEGTAAAEAMSMAYGAKGRKDKNTLVVSNTCHPQTIEILKARAEPLGIDLRVEEVDDTTDLTHAFAVIIQYPDTYGIARNYASLSKRVSENKALLIACCDLLSLTLLKPPGEWGADIAVGNAQRFGVPLGFGGPHAAFLATKDAYKRKIPGRLVGVSRDANGKPALRLALQTREQHIRRDKATSNICTAQALLANIASSYAVYHGPEGLRRIARRIRRLTLTAQTYLQSKGCQIEDGARFDTLTLRLPEANATGLIGKAEQAGINLRPIDEASVGFALDETVTLQDLQDLLGLFSGDTPPSLAALETIFASLDDSAGDLSRESSFLQNKVFNSYHTETKMLRYLKRLENKDLSLAHSMIPLGSCTMKLNATAEMLPISWPEFAALHPYAPSSQTIGYKDLTDQLESWLAKITGFHAVSLQPNAGSQGEYAGLLAIRAYHRANGDTGRNACLIPVSAHGTNPASAVMAGMKIVPVACDSRGNVDLVDLQAKAETNKDSLAALMITYPSTHGVFESSIREICRIVHEHGGQVYMDGANMNAQCGLTSPGEIGADVCHLNLHKTFCIPHGGGGPGIGPIGVAEHLAPYLPGHPLENERRENEVGPVSAAPWGSAGILPISWAYIRMMGAEGLAQASRIAILSANYMAKRLEKRFPIVYRGESGLVAHEFIVDFRDWKERAGIEVEDIAKRLMDYGFHAPTMSWPVPGTMMVEPTESESREELDRFCDALVAIKEEMETIENGQWPRDNNPLKNAPHTSERISSDDWNAPYSREVAAFPGAASRESKYWPTVGRVDNVHGDRNLVCSCAPLEAYLA